LSFRLSDPDIKRDSLIFFEFKIIEFFDCLLCRSLVIKSDKSKELFFSVNFLLINSLAQHLTKLLKLFLNPFFDFFFIHIIGEIFDIQILLLDVSVFRSDKFIDFHNLSPEFLSIKRVDRFLGCFFSLILYIPIT